MSEELFDDRYVRFREHADVRERVTALEGNQTQVMAGMGRIEAMLNARTPVMMQQQAPQETAAALALHRALDAYDKRPPNGTNPVLTLLAIVGACAITAGVMYVLFHH